MSTLTASPTVDMGATETAIYYKKYNPLITILPTNTAGPPTITPTITATFISRGSKPPNACTFPLAQITPIESKAEKYTFSQPKVAITVAKGNVYNIAEWLPDNQQVLITEELRNNVEHGKPSPESIELYNPETGDSKIYAIRFITHSLPSWQPKLNAVIYPAINYTRLDEKTATIEFTRQAWVSYGDPDTTQMLADNLSQIHLAVKPGGSETIYLLDKKISRRDSSLKEIPAISFDGNEWDYGKKGRRDNYPAQYKMIWQPGTSLIFLYTPAGGSAGGGYTFVLNANTGRICELDFGGWAAIAHWSSDGRYLAITRSTVYVGFTNLIDLAVLDTITGDLYTLGVLPQDTEDPHFVDDFTWAPDNRHILAIGHIRTYGNETIGQELYLVDFVVGQSTHLFSEKKSFFSGGGLSNSFAWSPDGSKLLVHCPVNMADRICFISVQRTQK